MKILVGISYMIGLIYGGYLVFRQELTLGELVSFNVYLGMLIWPMFAIGELINVLQREAPRSIASTRHWRTKRT